MVASIRKRKLLLLFQFSFIYPVAIVSHNFANAQFNMREPESLLIDYIVRTTHKFSTLDLNTIGVTLAVDNPGNLFATRDLVEATVTRLMEMNFKVILDYGNITRVDQPRFINILYLDSSEAFFGLSAQFTDDAINPQGFFLLVILFEDEAMFEKVFNILWEKKVTNVVIVSSNGAVFTYFPYQPHKNCNRVLTTKIDDLRLNETHEVSDIFPPKLDDFFGCEITVSTFANPPYMSINEFANGSSWFDGIDGTILRVLSQRLNFTVKVRYPDDGEKWGFLDANGTSTGGLKTVREFESFEILNFNGFLLRSWTEKHTLPCPATVGICTGPKLGAALFTISPT
jgi:hypothetical protein